MLSGLDFLWESLGMLATMSAVTVLLLACYYFIFKPLDLAGRAKKAEEENKFLKNNLESLKRDYDFLLRFVDSGVEVSSEEIVDDKGGAV